MSPSVLLPESSFKVTPLEQGLKSQCNFGAIVTGVDLNNISDEDVDRLKAAIWRHKVVVVKGQENLEPKKQWELVTRFEPDAPQIHSHGDLKTIQQKGGILSKNRPAIGIPNAENVRLIGKGYQGEDHYGLKDVTLNALSHDFHAKPLPEEEFEDGHTRFQRWHMDAPLYDRHPAYFTTLRCCKLPTATKEVTINWDDGSGLSMKCRPGQTAYISNCQLYEMLTPEEKMMVDHSWVEYWPYPYKVIENCKGRANGLGLENQGKEHTIEEIGEFDPAKVKKYPMVWSNPLTGEKAFQVHGICARRLFVRRSPQTEVEVLDDIEQVRSFILDLQQRILKPEYILVPPVDEGDVAMWDNYNLFHTAIDYPEKYGNRTMHQANIGSCVGPVGPVPIPAMS